MTPILKTLREVRKALELADKYIETYESWLDEAITSLNGLIAEIEKAEPFGWYHTTIQGEVKFTTKKPSWNETVWPPLYTHPAPATPEGWKGCGECDCEFPCYEGRTRCIRLAAAPEPKP